MNLTIRKGKKEDLPAVLDLIKELALYEKAPQEVIATVESMEEDGLYQYDYNNLDNLKLLSVIPVVK